MKKFTYTLLITFITLSAWGQSEQLFTFYMFNQLNFNPAYAGSKEVLDAGAIYRNQWWSGVDGSPKNLNVFAHMPFAGRRNGFGLPEPRGDPEQPRRDLGVGQALLVGIGLEPGRGLEVLVEGVHE